MKNGNSNFGFSYIYKIWQILKHFAGTFRKAKTQCPYNQRDLLFGSPNSKSQLTQDNPQDRAISKHSNDDHDAKGCGPDMI